MIFVIVCLIVLVIMMLISVSEKSKVWKCVFVIGAFLCAISSIKGVSDYVSGTPATEIKVAVHSVCEVVQNYDDGINNYAIIRKPDGSLRFVKTEVPMTIGVYKFEHEGTGVRVGSGVLTPFPTPILTERY